MASGLVAGGAQAWNDVRGAHGRMPRRARATVYIIIGGLWLSGILWLLLDQLRFRTDIKNISGATLSSEHVTQGVRWLLALWQAALKPGPT